LSDMKEERNVIWDLLFKLKIKETVLGFFGYLSKNNKVFSKKKLKDVRTIYEKSDVNGNFT